MGTFKGHLIPGVEFLLLGVFLNLIYKAEQLAREQSGDVECNYATVQRRDSADGADKEEGALAPEAVTAPAEGAKTAKIKLLFSLYTISSICLGVLYEGLGGIVMEKEGGFFAELGHLTMYISFLPAGIAFGFESGLLPGSQPRHVSSAPLLSQSAFCIAFLNQYFLLDAHAKMKKPGADFLFHKLWAFSAFFLFVVYLASVFGELANFRRFARVAQLLCPAALILQGSWVVMIGWILFGGEFRVMRNGDMPMERVQSLFGLTILFTCVMQYVWIEMVPARIASCYQRRINVN